MDRFNVVHHPIPGRRVLCWLASIVVLSGCADRPHATAPEVRERALLSAVNHDSVPSDTVTVKTDDSLWPLVTARNPLMVPLGNTDAGEQPTATGTVMGTSDVGIHDFSGYWVSATQRVSGVALAVRTDVWGSRTNPDPTRAGRLTWTDYCKGFRECTVGDFFFPQDGVDCTRYMSISLEAAHTGYFLTGPNTKHTSDFEVCGPGTGGGGSTGGGGGGGGSGCYVYFPSGCGGSGDSGGGTSGGSGDTSCDGCGNPTNPPGTDIVVVDPPDYVDDPCDVNPGMDGCPGSGSGFASADRDVMHFASFAAALPAPAVERAVVAENSGYFIVVVDNWKGPNLIARVGRFMHDGQVVEAIYLPRSSASPISFGVAIQTLERDRVRTAGEAFVGSRVTSIAADGRRVVHADGRAIQILSWRDDPGMGRMHWKTVEKTFADAISTARKTQASKGRHLGGQRIVPWAPKGYRKVSAPWRIPSVDESVETE